MPRKKSTTKNRIVKAAWNLFYKYGYHDTTVEDIIKLSKTSKGTFYHYFKGKDALLSTLSDLFDQKYEEISTSMDPTLNAREKLLLLNHELFYMIETSIDLKLLASLYSSQLITKDSRSLLDDNRYYFQLVRDVIAEGMQTGEFKNTSSVEELTKIYTMYERSLLYDWALCEGNYSLSAYSDRLLPHVLDTFENGI
ncbi:MULTISPECIES: TetR/AcrR family transcriptional regulator [Lachnospiraceae]|jgi:AcrR family transcriptional regulator|uniref:TetR/AcrR family transcriptional regulator n=1 Tax=Faecalicatena acetigenes TaxID=2981790 RepID=A0ABT2TCE6_9FIRM|nr:MULTISPECIES: TetR/AcrR family transcriptional regulator [Lachnospiraceae]MCU6747537.1 TetR/AcrR family transcriptional regulator [Faecalicatena acetigenes]RGT75198.1 TetR/AcrR family transcriptional regulator [Ruminococcus sp. AF18-22]SCH94306.1 Fatty acid metabolism regulator protein [uncultured Clostridium sp.]